MRQRLLSALTRRELLEHIERPLFADVKVRNGSNCEVAAVPESCRSSHGYRPEAAIGCATMMLWADRVAITSVILKPQTDTWPRCLVRWRGVQLSKRLGILCAALS